MRKLDHIGTSPGSVQMEPGPPRLPGDIFEQVPCKQDSRAQVDLRSADQMGDCQASVLARIVARSHQVTAAELFHHSRSRAPIALTRQMAMYLMHVVLGRSLTEVGRFFRRDRTTVAYACSRIEDMRDDREFDEELDRLEQQIEHKTSLQPVSDQFRPGSSAND